MIEQQGSPQSQRTKEGKNVCQKLRNCYTPKDEEGETKEKWGGVA